MTEKTISIFQVVVKAEQGACLSFVLTPLRMSTFSLYIKVQKISVPVPYELDALLRVPRQDFGILRNTSYIAFELNALHLKS